MPTTRPPSTTGRHPILLSRKLRASELRAERVGRLAHPLPRGVEEPDFEILLRRIDRGPILGGNRVEVFTGGAEAFAAMRGASIAAEREILLESYIFKDDATGLPSPAA